VSTQNDEVGAQVGRVVRSTGSWYEVQTSDGLISCTVRGKFRLSGKDVTNPVVVGDEVEIEHNADRTGVISVIRDRRNKLSRRAAGRRVGREHVIAANIDVAWIVQSVRRPEINTGFIDRFLVMAAVHEIESGLVINKQDLAEEADGETIDKLEKLYKNIGIPVFRMSALTGEGVDAFRTQLGGKTCVVVGPSGAGKSTLLNRVEPSLGLRTGEVSDRTLKGRHTTTFAELLPLSGGGFVVDTPGLREYGLVDLSPDELGFFFVEFERFRQDCRFPNCIHDHEPECRVKIAVEEGEIARGRYRSYINMLSALRMGSDNVGR
jgi:ribosome biogenesis GTPase / thiamine phosphate phosphatase